MPSQIHAYILSGGKSTRMGADKGTLRYKESSFIGHITEKLRSITDNVFIVSDNVKHNLTGIPRLSDRVNDIGPIGGIYTALTHSTSERNIIVSCDAPLISTELLDFIIQEHNKANATVISSQGAIHPLIGIYSKRCLSTVKMAIDSGNYKLMFLLDNLKATIIPIDNQGWFTKDLTKNINTPVQYKEIQETWK